MELLHVYRTDGSHIKSEIVRTYDALTLARLFWPHVCRQADRYGVVCSTFSVIAFLHPTGDNTGCRVVFTHNFTSLQFDHDDLES